MLNRSDATAARTNADLHQNAPIWPPLGACPWPCPPNQPAKRQPQRAEQGTAEHQVAWRRPLQYLCRGPPQRERTCDAMLLPLPLPPKPPCLLLLHDAGQAAFCRSAAGCCVLGIGASTHSLLTCKPGFGGHLLPPPFYPTYSSPGETEGSRVTITPHHPRTSSYAFLTLPSSFLTSPRPPFSSSYLR